MESESGTRLALSPVDLFYGAVLALLAWLFPVWEE